MKVCKAKCLKNAVSHIVAMLGAVLLMLPCLCACGDIVNDEFPAHDRLETDAIDYISKTAANEIDLYTLTVDDKDFHKEDNSIDYDCVIQYAWKDNSNVFTDDFVLSYVLSNNVWNLASCQSDMLSERIAMMLKMHRLFFDNISLPGGLKDALTENVLELSDNLYDFIAMLGGVIYKFPCNFGDLTANGWEIAQDSQYSALDTIEPVSYGSIDMENGDETVTIYLANLSDEQISIGDSDIVGFKIRSDMGYAQLGCDINTNSSAQQVMDAFGQPNTDETTGEGRKITYSSDDFANISFLFAEGYTEIDMFDLYGYTSPGAALFNNYNFNFMLDDMAYALPAPLGDYINNGWTISDGQDVDTVLHWYQDATLTLVKDEQNVDVFVENMSASDLKLSACSVTKIQVEEDNADFSLFDSEEAGGFMIPLYAQEAEYLQRLGEPSKTEDIDGIRTLLYSLGETQYLRILFGDFTQVELSVSEGENIALFNHFTFGVTLANVWYDLPCSASVFADNGWVPVCGWEEALNAGEWCETSMENEDGASMTAYICNTTNEDATLETCVIGGIYCGLDDCTASFSGNVGISSTYEELLGEYGLPYNETEDDGKQILLYNQSPNSYICFSLSEESIERAWIINFTFPVSDG